MPTGYTSDLYAGEEVSFNQFVLSAARGMGAAIMQRDDGPGPIADEYEPSDYHQKALAKATATLADYNKVAPGEWQRRELVDREASIASVNDAIRVAGERRVRYESMLARVEAWRPPTSEHEGFKKFMTEQLESSIRFDCSVTYLTMPPIRTPGEFRAEQIEKAERDVKYHSEEWAKEQERTAGRNKWVRDLKGSLDPVSINS